MFSSTCTDRSSCLGKQRYIHFKHSLFHLPSVPCFHWEMLPAATLTPLGASVLGGCGHPGKAELAVPLSLLLLHGHGMQGAPRLSEARPGCKGFQTSINISVRKDRKRLFIRKQAKKQDCSRGDMCSGHTARAASCGSSEGSEPPRQHCSCPHTSSALQPTLCPGPGSCHQP